MGNVKGTTMRGSHGIVFDVLRPVVRVLRSSGFGEAAIRSAAERACRVYAHTPARGIWLSNAHLAELGDVLMIWARDPDFADEAGLPRRLHIDAGAGSFRALLRKARCSMTPAAALSQLQEIGSVQMCDQGRRVRLVSSFLIPVVGRRFAVSLMLDSVRRFAETVEYNLCEGPRRGEGRMHRWAICAALNPDQLGEIERFVRSNGKTFLEAMDDKLGTCSLKPGARRRGPAYGVGLYVFVDPPKRARRRRASRRRR